jgi:two-component system response regulator VicR
LVTIGQKVISISPHEAELLYCLALRSPEPASRETLLNLVWGAAPRGDTDRRVEVCIHEIRRKIEPDPAHPAHLVFRRGFGYVLAPGQSPAAESRSLSDAVPA